MVAEGKRERLARTIAVGCHWLSSRSIRWRLLFEDIGARLLLGDERGHYPQPLPAATLVYDPVDLTRRTDSFNAAAEAYFARGDRDYLLGKPFTDRVFFARHLFALGVLFHWLRVTPGEVVLDMGAGSCWLSHHLNRFGCKTISADVSATALGIGRELFESDPHTNWAVQPEFVVFDGHRLPLEDGSVDKVVVYDAFHHIPNAEAVLRELARVLRKGGIIGMREPGRFHAAAEKSLAEVREFGVLENDIVLEDIERLGRRCGLDRTTIIPLTIDDSIEVSASELGGFMRARNLRALWEPLCTALVETNFILMYKGEAIPDTRRPGVLGEFNWLSQHFDDEVLRCRNRNGDGQTGRVGLRCVRLVGRRSRGARSSNGSGRRSPGGCRVRMPRCHVACRRPWAVVGSVRAVVCRRSVRLPDRLVTCPSRSGKRSRS